jgi:hypothetical protein
MGRAVVEFAHPVERELARLFDAHGVEWEYEPHTFVLERNGDGTVREAFAPDFYLPQLGLYVECTVMRQVRTNRKRRKAAKARATHGLTVHILYRRDFDRLARRWSLPRLARAARALAEDTRPGVGLSPVQAGNGLRDP